MGTCWCATKLKWLVFGLGLSRSGFKERIMTQLQITCFGLLKLFLWRFVCLQLASPLASAEDFCAVTLHVAGVDGVPVTSTWIALEDANGKTIRKEMTEGPIIKICDFGFGAHTLRVGTNKCLPVAISNLQLVIGLPLKLEVILNNCGYREQFRTGCFLYLRVADTDGHPIPVVGFSPKLDINRPARTDSYGRFQTLFGGDDALTLTKEGFAPATVKVSCRDREQVDKEIVMRRAKVQ